MTEMERFLLKVKKTENCWLWFGSVSINGYGRFYFRKRASQAHRVSYQLFIGELSTQMDICHKCDVRNCVNPDHLFMGTRADNMKDCSSKKRNYSPKHNQTKTHCPRGHEYTKSNTWVNKKGWRWCKACNRKKALKLYHDRNKN